MKVKTESMKLVCDGCGDTFETGEGYVCYADDPDGSLLWSDASASDWLQIGDRHYCPDCWERDDDDNILTKDGHKFNDDGEQIPRFNAGDVLVKKTHDEPSIKILAIVADQYKFECGDEFPHYEFFDYIETNYEMV